MKLGWEIDGRQFAQHDGIRMDREIENEARPRIDILAGIMMILTGESTHRAQEGAKKGFFRFGKGEGDTEMEIGGSAFGLHRHTLAWNKQLMKAQPKQTIIG
ncbi:hypothetical protein H4Q26_014606 [Puccinia striiformis f. sp. tritici PST-130]|nr:hypothetical protein H4Q26_014606 [Puccinia striiformis f. sp. tritici PST-130]